MHPTLELSMIVKNGAPVLERCLRSAAPFVDRILIGDTGSTDGSQDLARAFGAEVIDIPWEQDFSRARNRVLQMRKRDWILVLDADEMLDPAGGARIRELIQTQAVFAYHNPRWNYMRDASTRIGFQAAKPNPALLDDARSYPAYIPLPTTRLFRSYPGIYYEGCVHETVTRRVAALNLPTASADFIVHHFGHAEDASEERHQKDALYQTLGERKLKANPNDPQALLEMGLAELEHARRPETALALFERASHLSPQSAAAWLYAGVCLVRLAKIPEALERLEQAASLGLETGVYFQALGDAHFQAGHFAQASAAYIRLASLGETSPLSETKLGACEVHLGLVEQGTRRMQQAVAAAPEYAELYDILAAAALLSGNLPVAVKTVEARLRLGNPTAFHIQLVSAIQAQFNQQQAAKIA
jgi:tetratricopeptide (TPR) repeat protein